MERKVSLITGATGFVGSHMADLLVGKNHQVYGMSRGEYSQENISHLQGKISLLRIDIMDKDKLLETIIKVRPDYIFHFAAQSSNLDSFGNPRLTFEINVLGTLNLLEAIVAAQLQPAMVIAGSSEEYGKVEQGELPISETNPLRPQNPYAVSKIAASYLAYQYAQKYDLKIVRTRSFNQEGPRRQERYVISSFAKQIVEIELGHKPPVIQVGNLDAERDFLDVRDAVVACWLLAKKGKSAEVYNVCSGKPRKIKEILDALLLLSVAKDIEVATDASRMRASDVPVFYGDNKKIGDDTGWKPVINFEETLRDTLNYWREILKSRNL
jgi:GDP-4-dehydro-6-deoxy-D-mannose reductase